MSGYRDNHEGYPGRDRASAGEWLTMGAAVLMALAMLATAITSGSGWYRHFGIAPVGIAEFMLAWTFFARARIDAKGERYSPRQLRGVACVFVILGLITVAFGLITYSKGA